MGKGKKLETHPNSLAPISFSSVMSHAAKGLCGCLSICWILHGSKSVFSWQSSLTTFFVMFTKKGLLQQHIKNTVWRIQDFCDASVVIIFFFLWPFLRGGGHKLPGMHKGHDWDQVLHLVSLLTGEKLCAGELSQLFVWQTNVIALQILVSCCDTSLSVLYTRQYLKADWSLDVLWAISIFSPLLFMLNWPVLL